MSEQEKIQLFEDQKIRTAWDEDKEEWYFSVVDVIRVLTGSENPRRYWSDLKRKLKAEGAVELYEKIVQFKMTAPDGKMRLTDVANTEQLLRIMQSVPSPKAEPIRAWLAEVGRERIEETIDPEQAIDRALETYLKKGYDPDWVHQRLLSIRIRNELTDEWQRRGVEKGREFAILTDEISRAWSGMTTRQYKNLKGLKKENLRDNMSDTELVLTMLAEASTRDISKASKPVGFDESVKVAKRGGNVANVARQQLEAETGQPVKIMLEELPEYKKLKKCSVFDYVPEWKKREEEGAKHRTAGNRTSAAARNTSSAPPAPQPSPASGKRPDMQPQTSPTEEAAASGSSCGNDNMTPEEIGLVEMTCEAILEGDDPELEEMDDPTRIPPGRGI